MTRTRLKRPVLTCNGTKIVLQWLKEGKLVINMISQLGPMDPLTNSRCGPPDILGSNLAVEEYRVNRERFSGLSCTWYTYAGKNSGRHFHCSTSNTTALLGTKVVEASIQVPASLFYQLEMQGHPIASGQQLVVSVYENNRLFPRIVPDPSQQDGRDITSCVIGTKLAFVGTSLLLVRGLSKKYPTLNFPAQSSDSKAAPLCTVEGGTVMRMLEFFHRIRLCQSLAGGRQMTERIERRYCIKFCQKLGDSQSQTIRKIQQVFGEDAMDVTQIKEWFNRFKDGRTSAESEQHCGRPQTARSAAVVERVRNLVMADRRLAVREIAEEVGVSKDSAHAILRDDLNMNRVAAKFVPKLLFLEQKDLRRDVAQDLVDTANTDPGFLNTSSQWKHPESPRPKKARQVRSKIKVMLTVFFDVRGIVHHEYAPEGQTVTKEYYHDVLQRLRDAVQRKRPDMWTANNWHLHHDNAPAHSSQLIHTFLAKHGITTVRQPPYSPDLAPCDFWLFPKLKTPLKGSRFGSREEIMRNAMMELNTIPKEDFQRCFRQWKDRWAKLGIEVQNLTHPVYVMLRAPLLHHTAGSPKPVWWDSLMNNGTGGWSQTGCQLSHFVHGLLVFQCNRLGYFGLLQKDIFLYDHMGRVSGAKFRFSHPAVYVGSVVGVISLMVAIVTYIICHASIQMSKKTKHSLINTWVAMALLCFMYSLGIHQTEDVKICQGVGLLLHYLTLSSLLWMAVTASNMYKRLTKSDSLDSAPDDELPPDQPVAQKPLLGLYLVGWGIALIVCGISGAVNMREYAGYSHCFLMPGPALSAVFVPMGLLVLFLLVFFLLIHCGIQNLDTNGQLSEGTQATENVDLDLLDSNITNTATAERTSLHSASTPTASSDVEDLEHSPQSQLKAHVIVLLLYLLMWTSAAFATAKPLKNYLPYDEIIFSILYGLLASCLGMFVSFFYCVARSDVRAQWHLMECWCRRRRGRCCRTRSISDTNPSLPPSQPLAPVPNIGPRSANQAQPVSSSNSINSSAQTAKSHNSSVAKAAVELNGTVKCDFETGTKISNVNLIVLHRQQYRSNNSVTTFTEASGASGAEMFYNPHQSTVARKFFRKQRRHMKHNNLGARRRGDGGGGTSDGGSNTRAESAVFLSSDMENTSGKVAPSIYAPGSKVNNTNIHVEHPHHSRHREKSQNPNVLTDSGGDEVAIDSQNLPLERLVIGAEETSTSAPLNNDGTPRSPASGCGSTSGNNRIKSVEELPEEVTLLTTELNKMESEMQQVNNLSKDDVDNKLQCYSNNSCDKFPVQRTGSSTSVADTRKTWQDDSADGKGNGSDLVTCSAPCNTQIKTEPLDLDCAQQKLHDNSSAASSGGDLSDIHHKHVYRGSLHRRNSEHSKQEKSYTDIDSMAQPPENLLKGKKLSLPVRELNGYSGEECIDIDDVPTLNKKETSV
ncbi:hypothetical protein ANN_06898 [Periplaneta americana]|uniref:G-protein coupled receptors family 2 profile 2 domain-containing protein n=1 Tax=Periplaneta americana TaxID=6978 RepID=A0ABQ8TGR2_PERAM|nr:hypothetical protein ANN_06898 [Periplaneta americana]